MKRTVKRRAEAGDVMTEGNSGTEKFPSVRRRVFSSKHELQKECDTCVVFSINLSLFQ